MGGSVLANMSSLYSHVAWHMHIQSQFKWTQTINNKQALQCPQKQFSTHNSHLRSFSWKFFQSSVRSCAATPGVLLASLRTGEILGVWSTSQRKNDVNPDGRCTFPSLQRSYWQHWASISGTISFTPVQGRTWQAGCFSHDLRQQAISYQTEHMGDWDNISKKAFKCLCISDHQGYCDRFCYSDVLESSNGILNGRCIDRRYPEVCNLIGHCSLQVCFFLARCPCMKAPNSTSPVSVHYLEFWILSPRTYIWPLVGLQKVCFSLTVLHEASHDISIHFPMPDVTGPFSGVPSTIYSLAPLRSLVWRISLRFAARVPGWRGCNWWWWEAHMLSGERRWGKFVHIAVCTHLHFKVRQASKYLEFSCLMLAVLSNFGFRPTDPYKFPATNLDQPSVVTHGQKLQNLGGGTSDHHGQSQQSASWLDWRWIEDTVPCG